MVLYKNGGVLYKGVCQLVAENIDRLAQKEIIPAFPSGSSKDPVQQSQEGELLLRALRRVWDDHTGNMSKLRDILKYMVSIPPWYTLVTHETILRIVSIQKLMMFQKSGTLAWISS